MNRARIRTVLTFLTCGFLAAGCGVIADTAYKLGDGQYQESSTVNRATEYTETAMEYELNSDLQFACFSRTRAIERSSSVTKTYEYRGGYDKSTYSTTAGVDVVVGALLGGTLLAICNSDDTEMSCLNALWASPFAVDFIYSMVRRGSARQPVLVDKSRSEGSLVFGAVPIEEQQTDCSDVASLWLGSASGFTRESRLSDGGDSLSINEGALALKWETDPVTGVRKVLLSDEAIRKWGESRSRSPWAVGKDGNVSPITVDRCTALRPHASKFTAAIQDQFNQQCPLPSPTGSTHQ